MRKVSSFNKMGISFIEILITLLVVGIITAFVVPTFLTKGEKTPKKIFCANFAVLIQESLQQAIMTNKVHQIFFDLDEHMVIVKIHDPAHAATSEHDKFIPVAKNSYPLPMTIPQDLEFKNFFINGKDEFTSGNTMHTAWFYIMPDGTSQSIILNIEDTQTL